MTDQLRLFNPDNPPQAFSNDEVDAKLDAIKAQMRQAQMERIRQHNVAKRGGA